MGGGGKGRGIGGVGGGGRGGVGGGADGADGGGGGDGNADRTLTFICECFTALLFWTMHSSCKPVVCMLIKTLLVWSKVPPVKVEVKVHTEKTGTKNARLLGASVDVWSPLIVSVYGWFTYKVRS